MDEPRASDHGGPDRHESHDGQHGHERGLAELALGDFVSQLGSDAVAPGAGAAGAVALALAAACAGKAVAITLRHRPHEDGLKRTHGQLLELAALALSRGEEDERRFEAYMRSRDAASAARLLKTGEHILQLALGLKASLHELEPSIHPIVKGDLVAARALCEACLSIQAENQEENLREAPSETEEAAPRHP